MLNIVTGIIGVAMLGGFLGFMLVWVPAPPLIAIVALAICLLIYDLVQTVRFGVTGRR